MKNSKCYAAKKHTFILHCAEQIQVTNIKLDYM